MIMIRLADIISHWTDGKYTVKTQMHSRYSIAILWNASVILTHTHMLSDTRQQQQWQRQSGGKTGYHVV